MDAKITVAMENMFSYIENNDDFQFTYIELMRVLEDFKLDDKSIIKNLMIGMEMELLRLPKIHNQILLLLLVYRKPPLSDANSRSCVWIFKGRYIICSIVLIFSNSTGTNSGRKWRKTFRKSKSYFINHVRPYGRTNKKKAVMIKN